MSKITHNYFIVYLFKRRFHLKQGEEIQLFDI